MMMVATHEAFSAQRQNDADRVAEVGARAGTEHSTRRPGGMNDQ
jgi:hypothetical protein